MPEEMIELGVLKKNPPPDTKVYKPKDPTTAVVLSNDNLTPQSEEDWHHVVLDISRTEFRYLEGQSVGIIPPGETENGRAHRPRLYSIASCRRGDDEKFQTVTLSVKRVIFEHPETGEKIRGLASNYICDLKPGDRVSITGPTGKAFLLPENPDVDLLLFATGTGIAPFRSFLKHIYREKSDYSGRCLLVYGVRRKSDLAYLNETNQELASFENRPNFKLLTALSRENPDRPKVYVQHRLLELKDEVWDILRRGNFCIYICGLKGMEKGIEEALREIVGAHGFQWEDLKERFRKEGRWNQEVY